MRRSDGEGVGLDQLVAALTDMSECCSGCTSSSPLPSVSGVLAILSDLRELLFPGIHRTRGPAAGNSTREVEDLLARIQSRLRIEIGRALSHARSSSLRVVAEGGASKPVPSRTPTGLTDEFLSQLPAIRRVLMTDVAAAYERDPAARGHEEILLCYPGIEAVFVYRIAHQLLLQGIPYLPRIMTESAHRATGIDIHPGASIGEAFFIDHGTGVVIGETSILGKGVTLYQGVTLGAWSFPRDEDGNLIRGTKRHPTLEDNVTVYSNATILGGLTVIGRGSQIGSSVSLNRSVPPNTVVTIEKPSLRFREAC